METIAHRLGLLALFALSVFLPKDALAAYGFRSTDPNQTYLDTSYAIPWEPTRSYGVIGERVSFYGKYYEKAIATATLGTSPIGSSAWTELLYDSVYPSAYVGPSSSQSTDPSLIRVTGTADDRVTANGKHQPICFTKPILIDVLNGLQASGTTYPYYSEAPYLQQIRDMFKMQLYTLWFFSGIAICWVLIPHKLEK